MRRMREDHLHGSPVSMTAKEGDERSHPAKSSSGKLFRHDPVSLSWYSVPSHSHKQWGHL